MFEIREKNDQLILMGFCAKLWNLHIWWYHRPSTPTGPVPKIGHTHFIFVLSYSRNKLSHHTKLYRNPLKNKKVMALSSPLHLHAAFVRKWKCLKLVIFKDPSIKTLYQDAKIMQLGIFLFIKSMFMTFFFQNQKILCFILSQYVRIFEDLGKTINFVRKWKCLKFNV